MILSKLFGRSNGTDDMRDENSPTPGSGPRVLNVGGHDKSIPIPGHYAGWEHLLLDIDPTADPDVLCDARELDCLDQGQFDAVYCSHNLEHYYPHEVPRVLSGFHGLLKPAGFVEIHVPDIRAVMDRVVTSDMDIEDVLYISPAGPIMVRDVLYGWGQMIEQSGEDFFAHKTGFTAVSLRKALLRTGFARIHVSRQPEAYQVSAFAFKSEPLPQLLGHLNLAEAAS